GIVSGAGKFQIDSGATLQLDQKSAQAVTFANNAANSGTLVLETSYSGSISGFTGTLAQSDAIDLKFVTFSASLSPSYNSTTHVLSILNGATTVATLTVLGSYNSSSFKLSDDGTGHLLIKDPPATIADGATLTVAAASSFDAAFADSTGTLVLSDPTHFTGTISAASGTLSSGDRIDLTNINSTAAQVGGVSYDPSTNITKLAITDGQHIDMLNLAGDYANSAWSFTSDGSGGTIATNSLPASGA